MGCYRRGEVLTVTADRRPIWRMNERGIIGGDVNNTMHGIATIIHAT